MNYRMIAQLLGKVLCTIAAVLLLPAIICLLYRESPFPFLAVTVIMALCGAVRSKFGWRWISDYALPISLLAGMISAIPITAWLG